MFKVSLRSVWVPLSILGVVATCAGEAALGSPRAVETHAVAGAEEPLVANAEAVGTADATEAEVLANTEGVGAELNTAAAPSAPLRRLLKRETTRAIAKEARRIIDAHAREAVGTEIAFAADGEHYVARIERHYHPPGGEKKPWGEHAGVSVFVARPWPDDVAQGTKR